MLYCASNTQLIILMTINPLYFYNSDGDLEIIESNKAKGIAKIVGTGVKYALSGNRRALTKDLMSGFKELVMP